MRKQVRVGADRPAANHSLAPLGRRRNRLNLLQAQRIRKASIRCKVQSQRRLVEVAVVVDPALDARVGTSVPDPPGICRSGGGTPTLGSSAGSPSAPSGSPQAGRSANERPSAPGCLPRPESYSRGSQTTGPGSRRAGSYPCSRRSSSLQDAEPARRSESGPPGHSTAREPPLRCGSGSSAWRPLRRTIEGGGILPKEEWNGLEAPMSLDPILRQLSEKAAAKSAPKAVVPHDDAATVLLCSASKLAEYSPHLPKFGTVLTFKEVARDVPRSHFGVLRTAARIRCQPRRSGH